MIILAEACSGGTEWPDVAVAAILALIGLAVIWMLRE